MCYEMNDEEDAESKTERFTVIDLRLKAKVEERDVQHDEYLHP